MTVLACSLYAQYGTTAGPLSLSVRVEYGNDNSVAELLRVDVLNQNGTSVSVAYTDKFGVATFTLPQGTYFLQVTGDQIEETRTRMPFQLEPRSLTHVENISVRRKGSNFSAVPLDPPGPVIPEKAQKEFDKGMQEMNKKSNEKAREHMEQAVALYPKYAAALDALGVLAMSAGDATAGEKYFEQAIAADGNFESALMNLGRIRTRQKRYADAAKLLKTATSADPNNVELVYLLANAEMSSGQLKEAVDDARKVHDMPHEKYAAAHMVAAMSLAKMGKNEEAGKEYGLYLKEAPQGPYAATAQQELKRLETQNAK